MNTKRPNILLIMADQMSALALPTYGHPIVKAPNIECMADSGVVFENAYCNSPLCAPSRSSMMTGQLPSHIGTFDHGSEFPASIPTFGHYLRAMGYRTCLAGKMHFIGPDQLHGFEERLTTDIYPADFIWTPDWERPEHRPSWYHNMLSVVQAGTCVTSNQLDFDEDVAFHSIRKIFDIARTDDGRPFGMVVSFTHPHDPFAIPREYWDRYNHDAIELPTVPSLPKEQLDPHSQRLRHVCAIDQYQVTEAHIRNARHAYYSMISYVDDKIGQLLRALDVTGLRENTIVLLCSDHGEMLGERGLWYKMTFFEGAMRIPLIFNAPGYFSPRRIASNVSLLDLLPTLIELADDGTRPDFVEPVDGHSLVPLLGGNEHDWHNAVWGEILFEGAIAPCLMIRRGRYKYVYSEPDPDQLYDLMTDPHELNNLADKPEYDTIRSGFKREILARWNPQALRLRVLESQRRQRFLTQVLMTGQQTSWDFQPYKDASHQYIRNHLDLDTLERRARFPLPDIPTPDLQTVA